MSLMSWGALSISALLGAELSGLEPPILAEAILATSGPIAALLPLFCLPFVQGVSLKDVIYTLGVCMVLVAGIALSSYWIGVEVAGVGGGLAVIVFSFLFASSRHLTVKALKTYVILPYGLLIVCVVLQKLIVPHLGSAGITLTIATERISFDVLASPGIALLIATLMALVLRPAQTQSESNTSLLGHVATKSWPALAIPTASSASYVHGSMGSESSVSQAWL